MLSYKKPSIEKYLEPFVGLFENVNPNVLTLLGSIPSLLFFVFLTMHWYFLALVVFTGSIFDLMDGMIARKYNKVTAFGGFLDSTLDRVSDFFIITAFAFAGIVRWEIVAPFLLFSFLISYTRSRGELAGTNVSFAVGLIERTERLVLTIIALLLYMLLPNVVLWGLNIAEIVFAALVILSFYTFLQRVIYAYKKL
jgi:archaetidylinositol phosphate synthase